LPSKQGAAVQILTGLAPILFASKPLQRRCQSVRDLVRNFRRSSSALGNNPGTIRIPFYDLLRFSVPASPRKSLKLQIKVPVTAEVASSSLVVPAILSKRVVPITVKPRRVQKGAFLRPVCTLFRLLGPFHARDFRSLERSTLRRLHLRQRRRPALGLQLVQRALPARSPGCKHPA